MKAKIGQAVTYVDSLGRDRAAIVTAVHPGMTGPDGVNVVCVNDDENQTDSYGRKIERFASVCHESSQPAHGNKWR